MENLRPWINVSETLGAGVYALVRAGTIVYIGQSREIFKRIYSHRQRRTAWGAKPQGRQIKFDEVWIQACAICELDELEAQLIALHRPRYNIHHAKRPAGPFVLEHNGITLEFTPTVKPDAHAT